MRSKSEHVYLKDWFWHVNPLFIFLFFDRPIIFGDGEGELSQEPQDLLTWKLDQEYISIKEHYVHLFWFGYRLSVYFKYQKLKTA